MSMTLNVTLEGPFDNIRIIASQYTLSIFGVAEKRRIAYEDRVTHVVSGFRNGRVVLAIVDGHHSYFATRLDGKEPRFTIVEAFGPEDEKGFLEWLRSHVSEGPWYDLADAHHVAEALPLDLGLDRKVDPAIPAADAV